jgi:4-hydroxy-tetrahydrodipicolinate synthase
VVIAGVGSRQGETPGGATADCIAMAERAALIGADALMVYAPTWLRGQERDEELIIEHHRRISEIGLPLVLFYLYEEAGGISYSASVLDELLSMPQVLGIKMATLDSVMTYQDTSRHLRSTHPQKLLITGEDRFLGYSLMRGAGAALIGMGAVCCAMQADLITAFAKGDAHRFLRLSDRVDMLAESLFIAPMEGYIRRVLWALVHLGVIPLDAANDPWGPRLPQKEFEQIGATLAELQVAAEMAGR